MSERLPSAPSTPSAGKRAIVVGGGLAGIAAAVALQQAQWDVTLLESRFALGGRAGSFEDPQTDQLLDNCQHVLLGCCTNLLDLYARLGVADRIGWEKTVHFLDPKGRRYDLYGVDGLPSPLHLAPAFLMFGLLTLTERLAVQRAMTAMIRLGKSGREQLDGVSFGEWLDQHHTPPGVITKYYDPVLISALNEETRAASAKYAIAVFQDAMLANHAGYVMGLPNCPLGELYAHVRNVNLRLNTRVAQINFVGNRTAGVTLQSGETLTADVVVCATNHHSAARWIPPELAATDARFANLDKLESVPILGAHLTFDRPVLKQSHAALVEGPLQWLFRKNDDGSVLHGVISAARTWSDVPKADALAQFEKQIRGLFPHAKDAKLERGVIVIEKRATFSPRPGADAFRPAQAPPSNGISNLFLAGDYTRTDWPATMEGAVRSGYLAAGAITGTRFLKADLPIDWPARLMGLGR
jgi:squalene-associated FAD-dependent desaturase